MDDTVQFLYEVKPNYWHILPSADTTQELNMKSIKSASMLYVRYLYQKDGSRFKCIYSKNFDAVDIVKRLEVLFPHRPPIWVPTPIDVDRLLGRLKSGLLNPEKYEYRVYHTHTFLNGKRYLPIIIAKTGGTFYAVENLFKNYTPEDDLGLLVDNEEQLVLPFTDWIPKVITYQSFVRLCPCCGVVSDISKPKKNPWLSKKQR